MIPSTGPRSGGSGWRRRLSIWAAAGVLATLALLAACDLNPQPLPPLQNEKGTPTAGNEKENDAFGERGGSTAAPSVSDAGASYDSGADAADADTDGG